MKKLTALLLSCILFFGFASAQPASAADFRSGEEVTITEGTQNLRDMYLFGGKVKVDAPVTNDLVVAGGDISLNQNVTGSLIVAGGNIAIAGPVGNTLRVAGGNIRVDNRVSRDVVVTGGSITLTRNAAVGGDVVVTGGSITIDGPVTGKVIVNGGNVTINNTVGGNVQGEIEKLTLGPNARINGNLEYKSNEKAQIANGASVQGKTTHTPAEQNKKDDNAARKLITAGSIYKLITDIIISVLLITFLGRAILSVLRRMADKPVENGAIGFAFVLLFPVLAVILLILLWLGLAAWLTYGLLLLISLYIAKIFLGWAVMRWWERRNNDDYTLDWKAGVFGPILLFIIMLIPIVGWLAAAILFFIAVGALLRGLFSLMSGQRVLPHKTTAVKKK